MFPSMHGGEINHKFAHQCQKNTGEEFTILPPHCENSIYLSLTKKIRKSNSIMHFIELWNDFVHILHVFQLGFLYAFLRHHR